MNHVIVNDLNMRKIWFLPPANVVCEGYVLTRVCHFVHMGGEVLSQHALQVVSQYALQQVSVGGGGFIPACQLAGFQAHTQGGS